MGEFPASILRRLVMSTRIDRREFLTALALGAASATTVNAEAGESAEAIAAYQSAGHPLDPLTAREIETVARLLRSTGRTNQDSRFSTISLAPLGPEPSGRVALAVVYQIDT